MADLIAKWQLLKDYKSAEMDDSIAECRATTLLETDILKAKVYLAVVEMDQEYTLDSESLKNLVFWKKPDQVRTGPEAIKKGKLVLVPYMTMGVIGSKQLHGSVAFGKVGDDTFHSIAPVAMFGNGTKYKAYQNPDETTVCAYYWVTTTTSKDDANMEVGHVTASNGVKVPVLKNSKVIPPYTKICRYVAPAVINQVSSLQPAADNGEADSTAAASTLPTPGAKKRPRKS